MVDVAGDLPVDLDDGGGIGSDELARGDGAGAGDAFAEAGAGGVGELQVTKYVDTLELLLRISRCATGNFASLISQPATVTSPAGGWSVLLEPLSGAPEETGKLGLSEPLPTETTMAMSMTMTRSTPRQPPSRHPRPNRLLDRAGGGGGGGAP
ncbi:hypothetical protein ACFWOG_27615 [Kitasatospora sp. NPDC058406]|uniref:hypothetical protein n=1 Tax=Kitasatospora sp. NPDC058406 TaxID=3346483 RepID=UPI0036549002